MLPLKELEKYDVVLGSASPRRKEILQLLGISFSVRTSSLPEHSSRQDPAEFVMDLAWQKNDNIRKDLVKEDLWTDRTVLITADTVVVLEGRILGKPSSEDEARDMLALLQGRTHCVLTGICVRVNDQCLTECEKTEVTFASMSEEEIRDYLDTRDYVDKAGSYGIQSKAAPYIRNISGDYYNVVGFPVRRFYEMIGKMLG